MGFYYGYFINDKTEARRTLVSTLEEVGLDQSVWLQNVIPNRHLKVLIFNAKVIIIS